MDKQIKRQSVFALFFLIFITGGIYTPFWFKMTVKNISLDKNKIINNKTLYFVFMLAAILSFLYNIRFYEGSNGAKQIEFSLFSVYAHFNGLNSVLVILYWILYWIFSFGLRSVLISRFNLKINKFLTFFFGPLYLQYNINKMISPSYRSIGRVN